jgi:DNA-directed RNA polymerase subunit H (RpoH/RPB5)
MDIPTHICAFRSINVLKNLISTRGFTIEQCVVNENETNKESIVNWLFSYCKHVNVDPFFSCRKEKNQYLYVFYHMSATSLTANDVVLYFDSLREKHGDDFDSKEITVIFLTLGEPKKQKVSTYQIPSNVYLQLFQVKNLMYDVTKHQHVPKHTIVTDEEFFNYVEKNNYFVKKEELPIILNSDPVAMFIGLRTKQICCIERNSEVNGISKMYRLCL